MADDSNVHNSAIDRRDSPMAVENVSLKASSGIRVQAMVVRSQGEE